MRLPEKFNQARDVAACEYIVFSWENQSESGGGRQGNADSPLAVDPPSGCTQARVGNI